MAVTRVVLKFIDENDIGANDNLGYRVYRKEFEDPCPNNLPVAANFIKGVSPVPEGKQELEFVDDQVEEGKSYYYRISFTRGTGSNFEEVVSRMAIGPVIVRSAYSLAYEGTVPGPDSGVPNFTSIPPLFHFDAEQEMNELGSDHQYGVEETFKNRSQKYSVGVTVQVSKTAEGAAQLEYWNKYSQLGSPQSQDKVWMLKDNYTIQYNKPFRASFDVNQFESEIKSKWTDPDEFVGNIIFDQGYVSFMVLGGTAQHSSNPTSFGGVYKFEVGGNFASTWFFGDNRVSLNTNLSDGQFNADGSPKVNPNWANKWSDGKKWQHPNPLFGQSDPVSPYSMAPGISHASIPFSLGGYISHGKVYNYLHSGADARSLDRNASIASAGKEDKLHLFVKMVYPDGSSSVYHNGKLMIHEDEPLKIYGTVPANGYIDNLGLANPGDEYPLDIYPMMCTRQPTTMFSMGVANFAEGLFYPEKLSTEDFFRVIAYFQDKYETLENQEAYPGY